MIEQLQLSRPVELDLYKIPTFAKTQVNLFGSMIGDEWARIYKRCIKKLLAITFLGQQVENQKQTKRFWRARAS